MALEQLVDEVKRNGDVAISELSRGNYNNPVTEHLPNTPSLLDARIRWGDHRRRIWHKYVVNGRFDRTAYRRSDDWRNEGEALDREYLGHLIVRCANKVARSEALEAVNQFKITPYALEKSQYIVDRFSELTNGLGRGNVELGFYLVADNRDDKVITDIVIPGPQNDTSSHNDITGVASIRIGRETRRNGKSIIGWGHSHGDFETFYSGTDHDAMLNGRGGFRNGLKQEIDTGIYKVVDGVWTKPEMRYWFATVLNSRGDEPALRLRMDIPHYTMEGGRGFVTGTQTLDFESKRNGNHHSGWLKLGLVGDRHFDFETEREGINEELLEKTYLRQEGEWKKLRDLYGGMEIPESNLTVRTPRLDNILSRETAPVVEEVEPARESVGSKVLESLRNSKGALRDVKSYYENVVKALLKENLILRRELGYAG